MTDAKRLERMTAMARKVWPEADNLSVEQDDQLAWIVDAFHDNEEGSFVCEQALVRHPRALDALEAALCVLAGEAPQWAVDLAAGMRGSAEMVDEGKANVFRACAHELLEAAKGASK